MWPVLVECWSASRTTFCMSSSPTNSDSRSSRAATISFKSLATISRVSLSVEKMFSYAVVGFGIWLCITLQYGIHVLIAPDVRRWGSVDAPADFLDNPTAPRKAPAAPTMKLFHRAPFWSNTISYPSSRMADVCSFFVINCSPWLKKISECYVLKCSRMAQFCSLFFINRFLTFAL